jgi:hypothetical protein
MAPTVSITQRSRLGDNMNVALVDFTFDDSYPAGGEVLTANQLGMGTVFAVVPLGSPGGATYEYVASTGALMAYYADYSTTTDGLLIEVAVGDTAILDGVVVPLLVLGT